VTRQRGSWYRFVCVRYLKTKQKGAGKYITEYESIIYIYNEDLPGG
jgi:hypothetical protein